MKSPKIQDLKNEEVLHFIFGERGKDVKAT